ncbi:MAG: hypothetical protein NC111_01655 [Bacteroides sp.]|nr:hypothetical protein [Bacteroides sp.]MCM1413835.1 hypothetical protein [Bacteroides sp.]MCM1471221.1 hypothetical protein [Bacteroides sp.]
MKKIISFFAAAALTALAFISCSGSKSQAEVNAFVTSMNNYSQSIAKATSPEEVIEIDGAFAKDISQYANSNAKLTAADREAIFKAIENYSTNVNNKFNELGLSVSQEEVKANHDNLKAVIDTCTTLASVVKVGS